LELERNLLRLDPRFGRDHNHQRAPGAGSRLRMDGGGEQGQRRDG
jgi:hypothetical protein